MSGQNATEMFLQIILNSNKSHHFLGFLDQTLNDKNTIYTMSTDFNSLWLPDEGVFQEVVVEIERPRQQKTFLGGYRHRLTGAEYHHAAVQTLPKRRPDRGVVVFSRDTQVQCRASKNISVRL